MRPSRGVNLLCLLLPAWLMVGGCSGTGAEQIAADQENREQDRDRVDGQAPDARADLHGNPASDLTPGQDLETPDCLLSTAPGPGLVVTSSQALQGTPASGTWAFLGVPYAEPPMDELRWKPPRELDCRPQVLDATAFPPKCLQQSLGEVVGQEDCLYLNVWTPEDYQASEPMPVLVFIHGGGNIQGSTSDEYAAGKRLYDGRFLATENHAVVVTVQYRLGVFGFLALDELRNENPEHVTGNYGILDLLEALRWVQRNIHAFHGDPARVMVFGESAGAVNTCVLTASPLARGLFHAALMQSGSCLTPTLDAMMEFSRTLLEKSGCAQNQDPASCLRTMDAASVRELLPGTIGVTSPELGTGATGYAPCVDGWLLTDTPLEMIKQGKANDLPIILGSNADEMASLASFSVNTWADYEDLIREVFSLFGDQATSQLLELYSDQEFDSPQEALIQLYTDMRFTCPTRWMARAAKEGGSTGVWRYFFSRIPETANATAASHGIELLYVFQTYRLILLYKPAAQDKAIAQAMTTFWGNLAANLDPNGPNLPEWRAYDPDTDESLVFGDEIKMETHIRDARCNLWDQLTGR